VQSCCSWRSPGPGPGETRGELGAGQLWDPPPPPLSSLNPPPPPPPPPSPCFLAQPHCAREPHISCFRLTCPGAFAVVLIGGDNLNPAGAGQKI
jgi:hypothetical protein